MTVLEKIKRCVSLVWDFQEIYGEEDIEDFCRNELHTYPQHNEIVEYFKHIENLGKENAELKEQCSILADCNSCTSSCKTENLEMKKQLSKAKELLNEFMRISKASDEDFEHDYSELIGEAEQFLNCSEKPNN